MRRCAVNGPGEAREADIGIAAEAVLQKMGIEHAKVHHPSYGGRTAFKAGIRAILGD